eukprot:397892_1
MAQDNQHRYPISSSNEISKKMKRFNIRTSMQNTLSQSSTHTYSPTETYNDNNPSFYPPIPLINQKNTNNNSTVYPSLNKTNTYSSSLTSPTNSNSYNSSEYTQSFNSEKLYTSSVNPFASTTKETTVHSYQPS